MAAKKTSVKSRSRTSDPLSKLGDGDFLNDERDREDVSALFEASGMDVVGGLSHQKWRELFLDFCANLYIDSKDEGICCLADVLNGAQNLFLDEVCEGLSRGVRHFTVLKARQLGLSTISLAMDLFWLSLHPGMQGGLITDTEGNKEKFRIILTRYMESLPRELKIGVKVHNRNNIVFDDGSVLDYLVAGVRKNGGLGRSRAFNFVHATECSSWGDEEGESSLRASMSQIHPNRLYIFESTARGYNLFYGMWQRAKSDHATQKAIFIGWWAKESYSVKVGSEVFKKYWNNDLESDEKEKIDMVMAKYGVRITPNQIAWYRWMADTQITDSDTLAAEFPWTEEEAFVATGKGFFPVKMVAANKQDIYDRVVPFEGYRYVMTSDFTKTECQKVKTIAEADLRVWEHPSDKGYYAIGVDPAYGRDEDADRSVITVWRCYADKMIQVAEYATSLPETHHLAWVMCHLAGNYKNCIINLELQGPGYAVMKEFDHLKLLIANGYLDRQFVEKPGMLEFFNKAKWYLYHKPDTMGSGYVYNFKTNSESKQTILNEMRSQYQIGAIEVKSVPLLEEMLTMVQDGVEICASGNNKDDRVMATAFACKIWIDQLRRNLVSQNKTVERQILDENNEKNPYNSFMQYIYQDHLKNQKSSRIARAANSSWGDDDEQDDDDAGEDDTFDSDED